MNRRAWAWVAGISVATVGTGITVNDWSARSPKVEVRTANPLAPGTTHARTTTTVMKPSGAAGTRGAGADVAIAPELRSTYIVKGNVPELGGSATVWRILPGPVDQTVLKDLAVFLGFSPTQIAGWKGGPEPLLADGHALSVNGASWYYSGGDVRVVASCAGVGPVGPPTTIPGDVAPVVSAPECQRPAPPAGVPGVVDAEAIARKLWRVAGVDLTKQHVSVEGDDFVRQVVARTVLDGATSPVEQRVSLGGQAVIEFASGTIGDPVADHTATRIGTSAAIAILQGHASGSGGGTIRPWPVTAFPNEVPPAVGAPGSAGGAPAAPGPPDVLVDGPTTTIALPPATPPGYEVTTTIGTATPRPLPPVSVEPPPAIEIVGAEPSWQEIPDGAGTLWLVPTYDLLTADGGRIQVVAIDMAFLPGGGAKTPAVILAPGIEPGPPVTMTAAGTP